MLLIILSLLLCVHHIQCLSVNFTDCGLGNVKEVRVVPCNNNPCILKLGTNVTVEADFIAPLNTNKLSEVIKGVIRGRELPFPEQRSDPCNSGNILPKCPMKKGGKYKFIATFEIKEFYPAIPIKVKYTLADPTGQTVACVQLAAKIVDPNPKNNQKARGRNRSRQGTNKANKKNNNNS